MSRFLSCFSGFFHFRRLKTTVLLLVLSGMCLVIYLAFFTHTMEHYKLFGSSQVKKEQVSDSEKSMVALQHSFKQSYPPTEEKYRGKANMHVFEDWCGGSTEQLRKNVLYPLFPHTQTTVSKLAAYPGWRNYSMRLFGYIHPASSGSYIFAISSDKNSEFWLSSDENLTNLQPLAYVGKTGVEWSAPGEFRKFASQISRPVTLLKDQKYFFEVLYQQNKGLDHLEVAWRLNQRNSSFTIITSEYLSLYTTESSYPLGDTAHIPQTAAVHEMTSKLPEPEVDMVIEDPRDSIYKIPLMDVSYLTNVIPECDYKPIHVFNGQKMTRYHGVYYVYYSAVYPNDYTRQTHTATDEELCFYKQDVEFKNKGGFIQNLNTERKATDLTDKMKRKMADPDWTRVVNINPVDFHLKQPTRVADVCKRAGNVIMDEKEVMPVVEAFMNQLQTEPSTSELVLKRVLNVERRVDSEVGTRYLLELELEDGQAQNMLLSRYFFVEKTTSKQGSPVSVHMPALCSPRDFSWNPTVKVNVILTVKNLGKWVIQFIKQMENICQTTGDKNINIIIVDYSSDDLDIEQALTKAKLPSYQYKKLEGKFLKATALQTAIDLSEDEDSILFICDLHLNFPTSIIHTVRKHTVQGKMVFAPVVMRLDCGSSAQAPTEAI
ncbi:beta-1,4-N-acetylgalactosaminyltransferase 3-like isoform X2 [Salminus brasiliensis]|uniref:beta-1,4-N-acetylgalactosaminyltransferase 3-like isoform X2 n=1 Tax=Salminus brasiliensis TaxID=930266 RepID=UPI003B835C69